MHAIDEQLIDSVAEEIASFGQDDVTQHMSALSDEQGPLLAMIIAQTEDLDQDTREAAIYLFFAVHAMFRQAFGRAIPQISIDEILDEQEQTQQLIENVEELPEENWEADLLSQNIQQPSIIRFILDELADDPDSTDGESQLAEGDRAQAFLALRSVVNLLDRATAKE